MKKLLFTIVLVVSASWTLHSQAIQVTGAVTGSEDGAPLPGGSVVVKGTGSGTLTDTDGKFTISAQSGQTLVFSFVGYKTQELSISDQQTLMRLREPDIIKMDEVLVVAYGTAKRSTFTGSAQNVTSDKLTATITESLDKSLSGKATGVRVTSLTGDPGSSGDIQIRGIGSITGSTSPLYIVDGIPIITGQFGNSRISSNVLSSINPQYIEYERAALLGYRLNQLNALVPGSANYGNETVNQAAEDWVEANYADYSYVDVPNAVTDWWSAVYGKGSDQEYQLSASGGTKKARFYTSLGYKDVQGIVELYKYKRYTGTVNIESSISKWFDLSFNTMLSYSDQNGRMNQTDQVQGIATASPLSLIMSGNPTSKIYNDDGSLNLNASFNTRVKNALYAMLPEQAFTNNKTYRVISSGTASIRFTDFLNFKSTNAIDYFNVEGFRYWGPTSIDGESLNGLGERPHNSTSQITSSNLLNFNDTYGRHSISALIGFETQLYNNLYVFTSASNYSTDKLDQLSVGQPRYVSSNIYKRYLQSFFSNINYNYDDRYYLSASIRSDQSSQLGIDKRDAIFYSLSASWRFSKESFLQSYWLTDGKIEFSYGKKGHY